MNGDQLHQVAIEIACNLPFSEQSQPFGPECDVFKILEKVFLLGSVENYRELIKLAHN